MKPINPNVSVVDYGSQFGIQILAGTTLIATMNSAEAIKLRDEITAWLIREGWREEDGIWVRQRGVTHEEELAR